MAMRRIAKPAYVPYCCVCRAWWPAVVTIRPYEGLAVGQDHPDYPFCLACLKKALTLLDPQTGNVYADYLDDNDEPQAAAKLRAAFPLGAG